jgi:cell division protein FtsI/penicillin-binding protein 2
MWVVVAVMLILLAAMVSQLVRYQLFPTNLDEGAVPATTMETRGAIVDRSGSPLVVNRYFFQLTVTPAHIKSNDERHELAESLQKLIGLPYQQTLDKLNADPNAMWAVLADAIPLDDARKIFEDQQRLREPD